MPGHTRPVSGATNARDALTANRDGIRSLNDQTIEGMKKGERPDDLVAHVKLPPDLAGSPYLQEFYGTFEWSVRAIYSDHVGWFDGNATRLFPMPEAELAVDRANVDAKRLKAQAGERRRWELTLYPLRE